jgi:hypothetical protein
MKIRMISATAAAMLLMAGSVLAQPADSQEQAFDMARMNETMERIRSVEDPEQRAQLLERRRLHDHRRMK